MAEEMKHSLYSPSGIGRWSMCPGSVALNMRYPHKSSTYADEGTLAHELAANTLMSAIQVADFVREPSIPKEMVDYIQGYVNFVRDKAKGGKLLVEELLDFSKSFDVEGAFGTSDVVILKPKEIIIIDLKYGMGVPVSAKSNGQLMTYAVGAYEKYSDLYDFEKITLIIYQPRIGNISEHTYTVDDLNGFLGNAKIAAKQVKMVLDNPELIESNLVPGEKQCRFCRAYGDCPAARKEVQDKIIVKFDEVPEEPKEAKPVAFVAARELNPDALSNALSALPFIRHWCDAVESYALEKLLAGEDVTGFKPVAGRQGNRAWADEAEAEKALKSMRYKIEEMYKLKLISPTDAEKLTKDSPRRWKKLREMIVRKDGSPTYAPVTDPRPALLVAPVADKFAVIEDQIDDDIL